MAKKSAWPQQRHDEMHECCANCDWLWSLEDWRDYPKGRFTRNVCGVLALDKSVMALFGDLTEPGNRCELFKPKEREKNDGKCIFRKD